MTNTADSLRQILALLESERQAFAALDLDRIAICASGKATLCRTLDGLDPGALDEESRGLLEAVTRLNHINRQLRNLIAAGVESRLAALTGAVQLYHKPGSLTG